MGVDDYPRVGEKRKAKNQEPKARDQGQLRACLLPAARGLAWRSCLVRTLAQAELQPSHPTHAHPSHPFPIPTPQNKINFAISIFDIPPQKITIYLHASLALESSSPLRIGDCMFGKCRSCVACVSCHSREDRSEDLDKIGCIPQLGKCYPSNWPNALPPLNEGEFAMTISNEEEEVESAMSPE